MSTPDPTDEQLAFVHARRYLLAAICELFSRLRHKLLPGSTTIYKILGADGLKLGEHNQHQLDGQQVYLQTNFSHKGQDHSFCVGLTNDESWNMVILTKPSVGPDKIVTAIVWDADLATSFEEVEKDCMSLMNTVLQGKRRSPVPEERNKKKPVPIADSSRRRPRSKQAGTSESVLPGQSNVTPD